MPKISVEVLEQGVKYVKPKIKTVRAMTSFSSRIDGDP